MKKLLALVLMLAMLGGCVTLRAPDGTTETRIDIDTTIALTQLALTSAEQALTLYMQYMEMRGTEPDTSELEARQARIQLLRDALTTLYEARAAS